LGLLGILTPEAYGGAGLDYGCMAAAVEAIATGDGAISTIMSVQNSLVLEGILTFGNEAQKKRWVPPLARGEQIGAFALTEAHAGSDAAAISTRATKKDGGYVLNGSKQFITSGKNGNVTLVFAVTDPALGKKGMSCFIVPTNTPGYQVARIEEKLGQRCSDTASLVFEEMFIPEDQRLGAEGQGYAIALSNLEGGRIGIAAQALGMAQAALDAALNYAKDRITFGKPIAQHQAVGFRLADMATQLHAARLMVQEAARLKDARIPCLKEACMAKLFASEAGLKIAELAIQVHGGYGYVKDFSVERIYRDLRVCTLYEGTSDIQRLIISRELNK
jgi:alkylation response protein AidB-like acyl-CoA dehydrogenase